LYLVVHVESTFLFVGICALPVAQR
jgi:hypothetical protein